VEPWWRPKGTISEPLFDMHKKKSHDQEIKIEGQNWVSALQNIALAADLKSFVQLWSIMHDVQPLPSRMPLLGDERRRFGGLMLSQSADSSCVCCTCKI
jgi:hypothetical protein